MILRIDKELFQWEKGRAVEVLDQSIVCVQFFNAKSKFGPEVPVVDGKALIPNSLLRESLPISALACIDVDGEFQVVARREFKVLKRARPEFYEDDDNTYIEVIYDGGEEV